jgi:hypothetical protein
LHDNGISTIHACSSNGWLSGLKRSSIRFFGPGSDFLLKLA